MALETKSWTSGSAFDFLHASDCWNKLKHGTPRPSTSCVDCVDYMGWLPHVMLRYFMDLYGSSSWICYNPKKDAKKLTSSNYHPGNYIGTFFAVTVRLYRYQDVLVLYGISWEKRSDFILFHGNFIIVFVCGMYHEFMNIVHTFMNW